MPHNEQHSPIDKLDHLYKELETAEDKKLETLEGDAKLEPEQAIAFLIEEQHKKRRGKILAVVAAGLLIFASASIAGFFYFNKQINSPEEKIQLTIAGPQKAKIKEPVTYKITIVNNGKISAEDNKINILKPDGFWIVKTVPEKTNHLWNLGELAPFDSKTLEVTGYFIDDINTTENLKTTLTFSPKNFNSTFTITQEYKVALEPFEAELTTATPETVSPGEKNKLAITFGNPLDNTGPMEKIKIKVTPTADLQILSMNPKTEKNGPAWIVPTLKPGEKQKLELEFATRADMEVTDQNREQKFLIEFYQGNNNDEFFLINSREVKIILTNQELTTYLIVNGSVHDQATNLGDTLNCSLVYKNKSKKTFNNVEARITMDAVPTTLLDWSKFSDKNFGAVKTNGAAKEITWTKEQIPAFKEIKASAEGMFTFTIPLKAAKDFKDSDKPALANGGVTIQTTLNVKDAANNALFTINGNKLTISLNSDTALNNKAVFFYDDGTPIGSGPLPPKVGQTTKYKIVWNIKNSLHDLEKIAVTTVLPANVSMTNEITKNVGNVAFNAKTREVIWTIENLAANAASANAAFFVELKPTSADAGKIVKLTDNTALAATDKKTNAQLSITNTTLTTNLDGDPYGKGTGVIQN